MSLQFRIIDGASEPKWQRAFERYVPRVFKRASFQLAHALGGWAEGYRAFVLTDDDDVVANASMQSMKVILRGRELRGFQLGAVGVVPEWRGKGLQREIMPHVLTTVTSADLMFLFANDTVLDFYPKYGFRRIVEHIFAAPCHIQPASVRLQKLVINNTEDRATLARIAARALPVTEIFGARDYGSVLLWYWANYYADNFFYDAEQDMVIVAQEENELLRIVDVVSARPIELARYLDRLVTRPVSKIEFGFTPERLWPEATPSHVYTDSPLFVRGSFEFPIAPFKYPLMAQT